MWQVTRWGLFGLVAMLTACGEDSGPTASGVEPATREAQAKVAGAVPLNDPLDVAEAARGLIARPTGVIRGQDGEVLVDFAAFHFLKGKAPDTVNPSLWQQATLNAEAGLFKVTDGIYQVRGFDIANMTLIRGRSGWIVVDPLSARESASAALAFARQHLGDHPVSAVIYTHSHVDHFGGVLGVLSAAEAATRQVPIIASSGFMEEATSENVLAGFAMSRRSTYQFGKHLPRSATGMVGTGLGKTLAYGLIGLLPPTHLVTGRDEPMTVDGVRFVFHDMPGAEAPAELTFTLPDHHAYGGAELLSQTMHNLLPVRGAKVRDALRWSGYLQQALDHLDGVEVYFGQHNWPLWGHQRIVDFIRAHRDVYKYTHDQTVRLMNQGYTPREIAERVKLPASLASHLGARGYYGDLRHNVKAVYQFYLGAYDGNPAHLDALPPEESAKRYVALAGGADKALAAAREAFAAGDYRWTAELLNHVVFADPDNRTARTLLARTYDQLGYQAEATTWRNSYLTAAAELRGTLKPQGVSRVKLTDMLLQTPPERFLEAMAANLDGEAADGKDLKINLVFPDKRVSYVLWIENAVLHHRRASADPAANATLTLTYPLFIKMAVGAGGIRDTLLSDDLSVTGSRLDLIRFFTLIDKPTGDFAIVTP